MSEELESSFILKYLLWRIGDYSYTSLWDMLPLNGTFKQFEEINLVENSRGEVAMWRHIISNDDNLRSLSVGCTKYFGFNPDTKKLLASIESVFTLPIARAYCLWLLVEITRDKNIITKDEVYFELIPTQAFLNLIGDKSADNIIAEYAAHEPTRTEFIAKLLAEN